MTELSFNNRVYGSLAVAGIGDALGAPTELWTIDEILASFGGLVREFRTPLADTFAGAEGGRLGEVTDDASQMYYLAKALTQGGGALDAAGWVACLLDWADTSPKANFMGPSTRVMVEALRKGIDPATVGTVGKSRRKLPTIGNTNGAAMRVAPCGLVNPGDVEAAVRQAIVTCIPSHDTDVAVSSAAAIAAGVAVAAGGSSSIDAVIAACVEGAALGPKLAGDRIRTLSGPSFVTRLDHALAIAHRNTDDEAFLRAIDAEIGCSVLAVESVPAAIAILCYAGGDPFRTISLAASAGSDTDSIAAMAGSVAGAMHGTAGIPAGIMSTFIAVNEAEYGITAMADGLASVSKRSHA